MTNSVNHNQSLGLLGLQNVVRGLDAFTEAIGKSVAWLTLMMVVLTCVVVLLRRALGVGSIALQEAVTYMHAAVFLLGAAFALKHKALVRVDIFYRKFTPKARAWVDSLGVVVFLVPFCVFVAWISGDFVFRSWQVQEVSTDAGGLVFVYVHKSLILLFALTFCLQGLAELLRALWVLMLEHEKGGQLDD